MVVLLLLFDKQNREDIKQTFYCNYNFTNKHKYTKSQGKMFFMTVNNKNVAEKCSVFMSIVTFPLPFPAVDAF